MGIGSGWDVPATEVAWTEFSWFKVRGGHSLVVVALSDAPTWYSGHYTKGRMYPCLGGDCKMCADGIGSQLRYVIGCVEVSTRRVGLLEFSRAIALDVKDFIPPNKSMRGLALEFTKYSMSKNSRMQVTPVRLHQEFDFSMYVAPDIQYALVATWEKAGIPIPDELQELSHTPFHRSRERSSPAATSLQDAQKTASDGEEGFRVGSRCFSPKKRVR